MRPRVRSALVAISISALCAGLVTQAVLLHRQKVATAEAREVAVAAWAQASLMADWTKALSVLRSKCLANNRPLVRAALEIGPDGLPTQGAFFCGPESRRS